MENELRYTVRSRELVDLVTAMRTQRLTLTSYFQRNLVWRDAHRRDFIDTILKGLPFPQIFLARGPIDLETMVAYQCVVNGQQRLNTIKDFTNDKLTVAGVLFSDLSAREKEAFLKYEVAVIDFDLDAGDERLKDVFRRLNRTYYSLSAIEKIASEYSASEFLLVARTLSGEIVKQVPDNDEIGGFDDEDGTSGLQDNPFSRDPGIDDSTWNWLIEQADGAYSKMIRSPNIFSPFEFDRKIPLMFSLNQMCTYLTGYFNRNTKVRKFLEDRAESFSERDEVMEALNDAAAYISSLALPPTSMWWNKANYFSLAAEIARHRAEIAPPRETVGRLVAFSNAVPHEYALAAREGVGRKAQRELRGAAIRELLLK